MGQPSLPVLQHRLLQGLVAVQNGNHSWKIVQRKWVALGKRFEGVWLLKYSAYEALWQLTRIRLNIEVKHCLQDCWDVLLQLNDICYFPARIFNLWLIHFFSLCFHVFEGFFPQKKSKLYAEKWHYDWKTTFWEPSCVYNYFFMKKKKKNFCSILSTILMHSFAAVFTHRHVQI